MPVVFVLVATWLVINTLVNKRVESVTGLVLIALGLPLYFYFKTRRGAIKPVEVPAD
jgi:APA family basic amino acid/polyamine antiporter